MDMSSNTSLTFWGKFHIFYGPRGLLFSNLGRIIDTDDGCFISGHQKFSCDLFLWHKAAFGKTDIIREKKKCNREEDDGGNGGDDGINVGGNGNREEDDSNNGWDCGEGGNVGAGDGDDEQDSIGLEPVA
jgi:hypothetical protein